MTNPERLRMEPLADEVPSRVIIEGVDPEIDGGRFPAKRTVEEEVVVTADIFADGHESLAAVLLYRHGQSEEWMEAPMSEGNNDRWSGRFPLAKIGYYHYTLQAWIDRFASWRKGFVKKVEAAQDVGSELLEGAQLVRATAERAAGNDAGLLRSYAELLTGNGDAPLRAQTAQDAALASLMARHADRSLGVFYGRVLEITVDPVRARFGAWYELFPRSCADEPGRHATFKDVAQRLDYVAGMGFDVLYLPPIHPIGKSYRKGPNNTLTPGPNDPGSPWAIGGSGGGHQAVLPDLGTLADFEQLVADARARGIDIALDIAFQCSPDHPYVREHPQWFRHRPDGTIKYAENPPKKYQDIYPIDFECDDWQALWQELLDVVLFWVGHGVRIFRVDNPHTKPFRFWEWLIGQVQKDHPDTLFLAEAFTRPKVMRYLAKSGFTQSYTYFTWRNNKSEITAYFSELTQTPLKDVMRPNLFANTPDILPEYLQFGGPAAFHIRLVLAATLGATYGIYGPPFETCAAAAVRHGSEEYLDSEKYQLRHWDWNAPNPFRDFIARINQIRRENPALQEDTNLRFYATDNEQLIFYGKATSDRGNVILVVVNLDPHHPQSGWVRVPLDELKLSPREPYQVHDLISDARYLWHGDMNFVRLDPGVYPAHIFRLRKKVKTEHDFDYYF